MQFLFCSGNFHDWKPKSCSQPGTSDKLFTSTFQASRGWVCDDHRLNMCEESLSPLTQISHPLMRKFGSEMRQWQRWQMIMVNLRRQPLRIAQGSTMTSWHFSKSRKSDNLLHAVKCSAPDHSLACLLFSGVLLYVVMRFAESVSSLEGMRTRSQESSVIRRCPVTAVSSIRTCGCRYPILHLCHSAPTDQQSNFTQARSEGGNADAGMRIYAPTKTRSCLKWLEGWRSGGRGRDGLKN